MNADDKLVVSSFSIYLYVLKFHGIGFSREHIYRMYELINIHSSPELIRIGDSIIGNVLNSHVRRIRNGLYRYRFSSLYEQEIHFITTINDNDSAAYNFSLDAMDNVKQHYISLLSDKEYRNAEGDKDGTLTSIHLVIGNYYFWEQSYDEASTHYELAEKHLESQLDSKSIGVLTQLTEVYLKKASVAERIGNYTSALTIYAHAESLIDNSNYSLKGVSEQDSKLDILRQPKWARRFINLKRSAIHYSSNKKYMLGDKALNSEQPVEIYNEAVLAFFMDDFFSAYHHFLDTGEIVNALNEDNERAAFLGGNANLKAGYSLLAYYGKDTHKKLEKLWAKNNNREKRERLGEVMKLFLDSIIPVLKGLIDIRSLDEFVNNKVIDENEEQIKRYKTEVRSALPNKPGLLKREDVLSVSVGLMTEAANQFLRGRLTENAGFSYLSILMLWEVFLEMVPHRIYGRQGEAYMRKLFGRDLETKIKEIRRILINIRNPEGNWIWDSEERAFDGISKTTGKALSHFMKTTLHRNMGRSITNTLFVKKSKREMVLHPEYIDTMIYQHHSMFGQLIVAAVNWEEQKANQNSQEHIETQTGSGTEHPPRRLPYSIRYYSIMLWLNGRSALNQLNSREYRDQNVGDLLPEKMKTIAVNSLVDLFRASQYVAKMKGDSSSVVLPPLFLIYYNMWEVIYLVTIEFGRRKEYKCTYEEAIFGVRDELDNKLKYHLDVSSRILDLQHLTEDALNQFFIIEKMGDPNSRVRANILRNKYYIDDDYEDNLFNLDCCYTRAFVPGALIHRLTLELEMDLLKEKFKITRSTDES